MKQLFHWRPAQPGHQKAPQHTGQQKRARQPDRKPVLLDHRDQQRIQIVIGPRKQHLIEIHAELAVKRKAGYVKNRQRCKRDAVNDSPAPFFGGRIQIVEQKGRNQADQTDTARRLHAQPSAPP